MPVAKRRVYTDSILRTSNAILVTSHRVGGVDQQSTMFHWESFGLVGTRGTNISALGEKEHHLQKNLLEIARQLNDKKMNTFLESNISHSQFPALGCVDVSFRLLTFGGTDMFPRSRHLKLDIPRFLPPFWQSRLQVASSS